MGAPLDEKSRFYEGFAGEFDAYMSQYDVSRRIETIFDELLGGARLEGKRLLDAGCGTGRFSTVAVERGASVVSVDVGRALLGLVARKTRSERVQGSVLDLPFRRGVFDIVLSSEVIEHTPDPRAAIHEMARVLRPGGTLVLTVPNRAWKFALVVANALGVRGYDGHENWVRARDLRRWLRESGLELVSLRGLHLFPFVLPPTHGFLRAFDRLGTTCPDVMVNLCVRATRAAS